jgi:uncharacterized protein YjbJ (UPF0337 family)
MKSSVLGAIPSAEFTPVLSPIDCANAAQVNAPAMARARTVIFMVVSVEFDAEPDDLPKVPKAETMTTGTADVSAGWSRYDTRRSVMDWNRVAGNWKQVKGSVKEQWGKLTDDDIDVIAGNQDQLEGRLQQRYGYAKDQARKEVNDWFDRQKW